MYFLKSSNDNPMKDPMMGLSDIRECSKAELQLFGPRGKYTEGKFAVTMVINPELYLSWAIKAFTGGLFVEGIFYLATSP